MSVPNTFATSTSATGAQLDQNFAACAQLNANNAFSGTNTFPTQSPGDNTTNAATTAFVAAALVNAAATYSAIGGFVISSIAGNHTTASLSISGGQATATLGSATTQTTVVSSASGFSWAASNGNAINGTDATASTLANSTTYHVFICSGASGTGSFVSASLTPTFPTGYAVSARRIGSFNTTAAGAPIPYVSIETAGGGVINWLVTPLLDINAVNSTTGSRTLYTLSSIPTGVKMEVHGRLDGNGIGANAGLNLTSGDEPDTAPAAGSGTSADYYNNSGVVATRTYALKPLTTNTSGQIGARPSASVTVIFASLGWSDYRRS